MSEMLLEKPRSATVSDFLCKFSDSNEDAKDHTHVKGSTNNGYVHEDTSTQKVVLNEQPLRNIDWPVSYNEPWNDSSLKGMNPCENESSDSSTEMQEIHQQKQMENTKKSQRTKSIPTPFDEYYGKLLGRQWKVNEDITIVSSKQ